MQVARIGDFEVHRISRIRGAVHRARGFFSRFRSRGGAGEPRDGGAAADRPASGKLVFSFHSFVVKTGHHTILINSCLGNDKERPTRPQFHRHA